MGGEVVSFFLPECETLQGADPSEIDPDYDWAVFGTGLYIWILQSFLRLRRARAPVRLDRSAPTSGVVVVFADHVEQLLAEAVAPARLIVVSVRADRRPQTLADVEIVQNAASAGGYRIFIPHWLQPGLILRDQARGSRVEVVAYMGNRQQLHEDLANAVWADALAARGFRWDNRMVTFVRNDQAYLQRRWHDYSAIDAVVALRPPAMWPSWSKPAAKLQTAWAAGVPAILSPELPYREIRRSPLDYLEVESAAEALAAIERLRADPALFSAMVNNGFERAGEFSPGRLTARWTHALWHEIPAIAGGEPHRLVARMRGTRARWRRGRAWALDVARASAAHWR